MNPQVESAPSSPATPANEAQPARPRRKPRWLLFALCLVCAPLLAWGGYEGWRWYRARQFRQRCDFARKSEDWRTEKIAAREWAAWDPTSGAAWWYAAEADQKLDDLEELAFDLAHVPEDDPNILFAYVEKANLEWTVLNRPTAALETSRKAIATDPRLVEVQSRLISFYAMNLQRAPMLKAIRAAIQAGAEPKESYPYLIMADTLSFSNGEQLNSRWLAAEPDEVRFKIGLGVHTAMALARNADISRKPESVEHDREAMRQLQFFLDKLPHDPVLLTFLMQRALEQGDIQRLGQLLQQVDETAAEDHMVWLYRAAYHSANNELPQAEESIKESLKLHPLSPMAHHEYATLLRKLQRPQAEVEQQQKLAAEGLELRTQTMHLTSALDMSLELMGQLADYAERCGDQQVADALRRRMGSPGHTPLERLTP